MKDKATRAELAIPSTIVLLVAAGAAIGLWIGGTPTHVTTLVTSYVAVDPLEQLLQLGIVDAAESSHGTGVLPPGFAVGDGHHTDPVALEFAHDERVHARMHELGAKVFRGKVFKGKVFR